MSRWNHSNKTITVRMMFRITGIARNAQSYSGDTASGLVAATLPHHYANQHRPGIERATRLAASFAPRREARIREALAG